MRARPARRSASRAAGAAISPIIHAAPKNFLSRNPSFCISALRRYTQSDFIALVERHGIAYHEKTLGQLFCDGSSRQIVDMLVTGSARPAGTAPVGTAVEGIEQDRGRIPLTLSTARSQCAASWSPCGGKSIPKMGATGLGYDIAPQFGLRVTETRPPRAADPGAATCWRSSAPLAGVAVERGRRRQDEFAEAMLFTHRGSERPRDPADLVLLARGRGDRPRHAARTDLFEACAGPRGKRPAGAADGARRCTCPSASRRSSPRIPASPATSRISPTRLRGVAQAVNDWRFKPAGSEGYRTAEVTLGGVDTARSIPPPWRRGRCRASISSARWWTSPAGSAATISNGPGRRGGAPGRLFEGQSPLPSPLRGRGRGGGGTTGERTKVSCRYCSLALPRIRCSFDLPTPTLNPSPQGGGKRRQRFSPSAMMRAPRDEVR